MLGGAGLVVTLALAVGGRTRLGLIEVLVLFGCLVVVPLGLPLTISSPDRLLPWATAAAALTLIAAFVMPTSGSALVLSLPWLAVTATWAARSVRRWCSDANRRRSLVIPTVAVLWLPVAALHIALSRAGVTFGTVPLALVELGGVHFTFAGFGATTLAACLVAATGARRQFAELAATAVIIGSSLVGLGHLTVRPLELAGTVAVTAGVVAMAALGWNALPRASTRRILLRLSGLAVLAPMAFALAYSWALTTNSVHLPYETIAAIHGSLNAVGFVACGLLAWRLEAANPTPAGPREPAAPAVVVTQ